MATPAIGGVVSSETGTVSLTTVPSGGWMLATLIGDATPPATPSGWTSLATGDSAWRIVGKIKAAESSLSVPGTNGELISVMWGTGSAAASSWRAGAVGTEGSTSVSLTGTTAGSLLVGAEPIQASWLAGQVSYGGAVGFNSRSTDAASGQYAAVWLSGTAAGGTATATRSSTYIAALDSWVLVEIPEGSNPAALTATVPGPPSASITGGSTNPGALTTDAPGPASAALTGTSSNPGALAPALPGPPTAAIAGGSANPAALDAGLPGPLVAAIEGTLAGSILHSTLPGPPTATIAGGSSNPGSLDTTLPGLTAAIAGAATNMGALGAVVPGPPDADMPGLSVNPAALDTAAPGPVTITAAGTVTNPATLDAALPGPPAVDWAGLATNPAMLAAEVPGPPDADMSGVIFGVIALRRPPRTLAQLLRDGTRRRDLIRIQTGEHAGAELPVTSWSLTLDHLSTIRATGSAEVRHTPKLAALLDPRARTELAMILAIEDDDGHTHEWQKALLHTVPLERGHHMSIQLEDRAAWVRAAGMRTRIVMPAGMDIVQAITLLLGARAPWLPVAIPLSGTVLPQDAVLGGLGADPWEIASELARSIGHRLHIDPHGIARTAPITDLLTATPVAEWADDAADITDLQTTISDTDVVNVVGLPWTSQPGEGEPPDAITGGTEWWVDTTSSVSVAVMGDRVQPYPGDTSLIASAAQARDAAAAHGLTAQGIAVSVDIPGVRVDPRRDVGDIIRVRGQRLGLDVVTRLTGLTYASGAPTMGVTLADRRMI